MSVLEAQDGTTGYNQAAQVVTPPPTDEEAAPPAPDYSDIPDVTRLVVDPAATVKLTVLLQSQTLGDFK